jgi:hypothetical protein
MLPSYSEFDVTDPASTSQPAEAFRLQGVHLRSRIERGTYSSALTYHAADFTPPSARSSHLVGTAQQQQQQKQQQPLLPHQHQPQPLIPQHALAQQQGHQQQSHQNQLQQEQEQQQGQQHTREEQRQAFAAAKYSMESMEVDYEKASVFPDLEHLQVASVLAAVQSFVCARGLRSLDDHLMKQSFASVFHF